MNRYMMMALILMATGSAQGVWYYAKCMPQEGAAMRLKQERIFVLIDEVARLATSSSDEVDVLKKLFAWRQRCVLLETFDSKEAMFEWIEQCKNDLKRMKKQLEADNKEQLEADLFAERVTREKEERERPNSPEMHALIEFEEMQDKENRIQCLS